MDIDLRNLLRDTYKLAVAIVQNTADAQDVIQDAAAIAFSHRSAPNPNSEDFTPWFYRVVRNKSIDKLRANNTHLKRHDASASDLIEQVSSNLDCPDMHPETQRNTQSFNLDCPETQIIAQARQRSLLDALSNLRTEHREIVMLKDFHHFSYTEIANILDIAKGSVMSRLHRARLALKNELIALDDK